MVITTFKIRPETEYRYGYLIPLDIEAHYNDDLNKLLCTCYLLYQLNHYYFFVTYFIITDKDQIYNYLLFYCRRTCFVGS
jgi:hypothetical protein